MTQGKKKSERQVIKKGPKYESEDFDEEDDLDSCNSLIRLTNVALVQAQREKIMLDSEDEDNFSEDDFDEAVMDLPTSGDEEEEFDEDEEDEEDAEDSRWGRSKTTFYSADDAADDLEEEAREARKLQRKQLKTLTEDDFGVKGRTNKRTGPVKLDGLALEEEDDDDDDEEDAAEEDKYVSESEFANLDGNDLEGELLPEEERLKLLEKHAPETKRFLAEFKAKAQEVREQLGPLLQRLKGEGIKNGQEKGLSFLETKYQLLVGYCANLAWYLSLKVRGRRDVDRHPVVERLVKYKLLLEKIKPMETKLQYHIDKLLDASNRKDHLAKDSEAHNLAFRPNIHLEADEDEEDEEDDASAVYKAAKLKAVHFPDKKNDKLEERDRAMARKSRMLSDIQAEMEDRPEEETLDPVYGAAKVHHGEAKDRDEYEEENFVRFSLSKTEQRKLEKLQARPIDELEDLNDFFHELDENESRRKKGDKDQGGKSALERLLKINKKKRPSEEDQNAKRDKKSRKASKFDGEDDAEELSEIEDDINIGIHDDDDEMYKEARLSSLAKRNKNKNVPIPNYRPIKNLAKGQSRPATYQMMKNKGMTPMRSKDIRNPRVHHRQKWDKAQKKIKSFKAMAPRETKRYSGESSGIRTNISKSVKF